MSYYQRHQEERRKYSHEYYQEHKNEIASKFKIRGKVYRDKIRSEVLTHYGGIPPKCARCAFSDVRALQIDHVNGGGSSRQKEKMYAGRAFYMTLIRQNFPDGYQILCANCNWIKREEKREFKR